MKSSFAVMGSIWVGTLSLAALSAFAAQPQTPPTTRSDDAKLMALADDYFDSFYFPTNPTTATTDGIHRYDERLEIYTRSGINAQIKTLKAYETRFAAVKPATLSEQLAGDRELLLSNIRSSLLTLQTLRPWEKNADSYSSGITASAYAVMQRKFAAPNERLRLLIAREKLMPAVFEAARRNLRNPPLIYTQIALEQMPGIVGFFQNDLPAAFNEADDSALQIEFAKSNAAVIAALKDYAAWLKDYLLPHSHGDFRLGAATFSAKLRYDEMVNTPLDKLLVLGFANLRDNQQEFARVAKLYDPTRTPLQVLQELSADHPAPSKLLDAFDATFAGLVKFIDAKKIITIPAAARPILRETPPFLRATTFASMDTPGPYESVAKEAYFDVTLPDPGWDAAKTEGFMAQFNYPVINNVTVHEAYPGHYIQFLWMHRIDDRVRKLLGANTNAEGWAHYCEQMILDEGYGDPGVGAKDTRESQLLRLGQLQDALLRNARFIVGIKLHTGQMTLDQAIDFFVKEGYQSREVGEVETKRGTSDPTYLYYTLGKLQILKLRSDLKAREGSSFTLQSFHDRFMQQGFPPLKIVRKALLHDDSPTL